MYRERIATEIRILQGNNMGIVKGVKLLNKGELDNEVRDILDEFVREQENNVEQPRELVVFPDAAYDNLPEGEGNSFQYLRDLIKAILEVEDHYYTVEYEGLPIANEDLYERAFAYELYHQWSKYIDCYKHHSPDMQNLCINGEIKKCFWEEKKLPDLVLHMYWTDWQELIVEIKRESRADEENIIEDFLNSAAL